MASYHLSVKAMSRAKGRSATASAAYRSAERIRDERTGELHDYARKRGVVHRELVLPPEAPGWARDRASLWNAAEAAESRVNSTVAREFEVALPAELSAPDRHALALALAQELATRHRMAVDVAIHAPHRSGDARNHHAHLLCSTRRLGPEGFGEKTRELDERRSGEVDHWRARWAALQNERFAAAGLAARVDHRSLEEQGIERAPTRHKGPAVTAIERRQGTSAVGERQSWEAVEAARQRLAAAAEAGRAERAAVQIDASILSVSADLTAALREREASAQAARIEQLRLAAVAKHDARMGAAREAGPSRETAQPSPGSGLYLGEDD